MQTLLASPSIDTQHSAVNFEIVTSNPTFDLTSAISTIEVMRKQAAANDKKYVVMGRKAMLDLMASVYGVFYNAKTTDGLEQLMNNVRNKLEKLHKPAKKSSADSSLLIRYVFESFTDKQVHVYGRSLDVAFKQVIEPKEFVDFVSKHDGGFEGIRNSVAVAEASSSVRTPAVALSAATNERTVDTLEIKDWAADEEFRIFIAIRNGDNLAELKDAQLSTANRDATLLRFLGDKQKRGKQPKYKPSAAQQQEVLNLEQTLVNTKVKLGSINVQLEAAISDGDRFGADHLRAQVGSLKAQIDGHTVAIKALRKSIKEGTK